MAANVDNVFTMYIIKHKTRRRQTRGIESDSGYFVVNGVITVGTAEEAAEEMVETNKLTMKLKPRAPTLWDVYPVRHAR